MNSDPVVFDQGEFYKQVLARATETERAALFGSTIGLNDIPRVLTIDLSTAKLSTNPYKLGFPFRSFVVLSTTDDVTNISMQLSTTESTGDAFTVKKGGELRLPFPVSRAELYWAAQSGKSITIMFLLKGEFSTNILNLVSSGGVTISSGTDFTRAVVSLTSVTAVALFPIDSTRKQGSVVNDLGYDLYTGESSSITNSGATKGKVWPAGTELVWQNTDTLFVYNPGATASVVTISET